MIASQLQAGLTQVAVVLALSAIVYGVRWLLRKRLGRTTFFTFIGLRRCAAQLDRTFWLIWLAVVAYAVVSALLQFHYSDSMRAFLLSESSPYGKILLDGVGAAAVLRGLLYCFIQASASEELLFRGLIGKRLYSLLGTTWGNVAQAALFWLMHLFLFRALTGVWISALQIFAFVTSFGLGLLSGYVNFRRGGQSIGPSWLIHGSVNFATFLTLMLLWR